MPEKIILAPKTIIETAKKLKKAKKYKEALELLFNSCVEFDMTTESIRISKQVKFEKLEQPDKVKNIKSRWEDRIFKGSIYANL